MSHNCLMTPLMDADRAAWQVTVAQALIREGLLPAAVPA
jgi:hypothetical protein